MMRVSKFDAWGNDFLVLDVAQLRSAGLDEATVVWPEVFKPQACTVLLPKVKLGTSFTAAKVIVTVAADEEAVPSVAVTVKVFAPFSFATGTYVKFGKLAKGITWPAVTLVPESFSTPVAGTLTTVMLARAVLSASV